MDVERRAIRGKPCEEREKMLNVGAALGWPAHLLNSVLKVPDDPACHFWRLPVEIRDMVFEMAIGAQVVVIEISLVLDPFHRDMSWTIPKCGPLNEYLVSKAFYTEARRAFLRLAIFELPFDYGLSRVERCLRRLGEMNLTFLLPPRTVQHIRAVQTTESDLPYWTVQARRFDMDIRCVTLEGAQLDAFGLINEWRSCCRRRKPLRSRPLDQCEAFNALAKIPGLRNVHIQLLTCWPCRLFGRQYECVYEAVNADIEAAVLRTVLEKVVHERPRGGQARRLRRNIEAKEKKAKLIRMVPKAETNKAKDLVREIRNCREACGWMECEHIYE